MTSLEDARREVLSDFSVEERQRFVSELVVDASLVPPHLKVSCPCAGVCKSPSKRDFSKPKRSWVCGSNFSHDERMDACVAYLRLQRGLHVGVSARDVRRRR